MKNKRLYLGIFIVSLMTLGIVSPMVHALYNTTDPWVTYRHDLSRDGYTTTTAPNTNTSLLWTWSGVYYVYQPVIAEGRVIVPTYYGIYALDETTGVQLWGPAQFQGSFSQPITYDDGKIYAGTNTGYVYCINATTGAKIWEYQTAQAVSTATAVANGKVYFGTSDNYLYALYADNGTYVWRYTAPNKINSSPAVDGTWIYFGCDDGSLYALNDTGTLPSKRWQFPTGGRIYCTPVVANGMVFFGSSYIEHTYFALDKTTGAFIWGYVLTNQYNLDTPIAFYNGYAFLGVGNYKVYCLNTAATPGSNYSETDPSIRVWSQTLSYTPTPPIIVDGKVFVTAYQTLYALDASAGQILWSYTDASRQLYEPVVADGRLFVPASNAFLCFGNPFPPTTYDFDVNVPTFGDFDVQVLINATIISDIDIGGLMTLKKINFTVQGIPGAIGMTNVTVPMSLMQGPFTVTVDGGLPNDPPGVIVNDNGTHSFIAFAYGLSTHTIEITATTVLPEYGTTGPMTALLLATATIAFAAAYARRYRKIQLQKL